MSAAPKSRLEHPPKKLGIIAGSGSLPHLLADSCAAQGIEPFIVAFEGQTEPQAYEGRPHMVTRFGAAGQILETLKSRDIHDLVLIGAIHRPSLSDLKPDLRTAKFLGKIGMKALGDDGLLKILKDELEREGFAIHPVQNFAHDLLVPVGSLGKYKPGRTHRADITRGLAVSQALGAQDIGQSVVVQQGMVLAVEAIEGTDELIRRSKGYKRKGRGGVLVKSCKPQQDVALDLPTIGPETVRLCAESGVSGIAVQAGAALLLERDDVRALADEHKIFVVGIEI